MLRILRSLLRRVEPSTNDMSLRWLVDIELAILNKDDSELFEPIRYEVAASAQGAQQ